MNAFRTTRWSLVLGAGSASPEGKRALEELCASYWYPLYAVARHRGREAHAAEDLVQGFFAQLLEREDLRKADPDRGRFRGFLRTAFENFMRNEHAHRTAVKRGGNQVLVSLDAEQRYGLEPAHLVDPESLFDRAWAEALLGTALASLRGEYAARNNDALFDALKDTLAGGGASHAELALRFDMTEGAMKVAAHRLRRRYRDAVRGAVAETVDSEAEIDDEIQALFRVL